MPAFALDPAKTWRQYIVTHWDALSGLPQNQVTSIEQSGDGLIWANSLDGLVAQFDGRRWNTAGHFLSERLTPGYLLAGSGSLLLAGLRGEIFEIRDRATGREVSNRALDGGVTSAARTSDGRLWIVSNGQLRWWDGASYHVMGVPSGLGPVLTIRAARNGELWIGGRYGLAQLRNGAVVALNQPWRIAMTSLAEGPDGTMVAVADYSRILEIRGGEVRPFPGAEELRARRNLRIADVRFDRHRALWLNLSGDGIARLADGRADVFGEGDGVPVNRPARDARGFWIWEDREGALWFGLSYAGVIAVRDSPVSTHGSPEGMPGGAVMTVLEDRKGTIWASAQAGLFRRVRGKWSLMDLPYELGRSRCLMESKDGTIWVCLDNAIVRLRNGAILDETRIAARPFGLAEDAQGQIWLGGSQTGILDRTKASQASIRPVPGVCESSRIVFAARSGAVWILCRPGPVMRFEGGKVTPFDLGRDPAESIHEDEHGSIWIGKATSGLHRIHRESVKHFRTRETEGPDDVHAIVEDRRGFFWLTSNSGLRRVSRRQLEEAASGARANAWFQHFEESSGLRTRDFSGGLGPPGFLSRDGSVLLASSAGVVQVDPTFDFSWQPAFEPLLDGVQVAGAPVASSAGGEISLRASESRVAFGFSAPMVWAPHAVQYQLAGFDKTWQGARDRQPVSYTNLPPGRYHFMVRILPFGGEPGAPKRLVTVNVNAPFYKTGWFLALAALLLALIGAQLANVRARSIRRQNERLEEEVLQRTEELQKALRSEQEASGAALARERDLERTRLRLEREIQQRTGMEQQLIQAQKMESVDRLAGGVAHDFNNLLTVIFANLELLKLSEKLDSGQTACLEEIDQASRRAADLTRQLLTFARRQIVEPKIVDLNSVIIGLGRILRRLIGEDVELVMILAANLGPVKVDPGQFEQILLNLVVNARDAMPRGGKLTIETHASAESVTVSVTDTGIGMDQATMSRIFEPFFTTKSGAGGTGLGLAICYGITRQAGGEIRVTSEPGRGSRFEVSLAAAEGKVEQAVPETAGPWAQGEERILVVEDENRVRELIVHTLRARGYQVTAAANGEEALRALEANGWNADLVIADIVMPLMGGRELAEKIAATRPKMRILYISGYTEDASFHSHLAGTGRDFLAKPFTLADAAHKVRQVLDKAAADRKKMAAGA